MVGSAACDGAILLQSEQFALVARMSFMMPGQKIDASAFDVMADVPWWEASRADRHVNRRRVSSVPLGPTIMSKVS